MESGENPVPVTTVQATEDSMELLQVLIKLADPQSQGIKQHIVTQQEGAGDQGEQMQAVASIVSAAGGSQNNAIMVVEGTMEGQEGTVAQLTGEGMENVVVHFTEAADSSDASEQNILVPVSQQLEAGEVVGVARQNIPKKFAQQLSGDAETNTDKPDEPEPELVTGKIFRYKCKMCSQMYESVEALAEHMMEERQQKKFCCEDCGKRFKSKEGFRSHRRIHTGETPYQCIECDRKFNNRTAFRYHQELKHSNEEFLCLHCAKIFQTRQCLRKHLVVAHGKKMVTKKEKREKKIKKAAKKKKKERKRLIKLKREVDSKESEAVEGVTPVDGVPPEDGVPPADGVLPVDGVQPVDGVSSVDGAHPVEGINEKVLVKVEMIGGDEANMLAKLKKKKKKVKKKRKRLLSSDEIKLRRPQKTAHLIRAYKCTHCPGQYTLRKNLFKHIRAKHPDQAPPKPPKVCWSCDFCGAPMKTKTYKREHERIHTGERPFSCRLGCDKSFSRSGARNEHERSVHLKENKATCEVCNKTFDRREMRHHVTIHTGEKPFRCPYCQNYYTQKKIMNKHIRRAHPGYEIPAPVPRKKSVVFKEVPQQVQDHLLLKRDENGQNSEGNPILKTLKEGMLQADNTVQEPEATDIVEVQVYKCKYCEKLFNNVTHLTNHENIHIQTKHYQCGTCGKMFKRPEGLTRHIGKHTGGFQCSNCGIYLPTYTKLQIHEEEHLFKCKMCKRKHETKAELVEHMKVHMKNTDRYQCLHCMKILATKSSLREHEKIHTEKIKCTFCSKEFVSHYMKKHMRTHSGDHPYLCKHCPDRRYTTPNALRVHMRRRHSAQAARTDYQATIVINPDALDHEKDKEMKGKDGEIILHQGVHIQDMEVHEGIQLQVSQQQEMAQQQEVHLHVSQAQAAQQQEVQLQVSQAQAVQQQIIQQVQVIPQEVVHQEVVGSHQITQQVIPTHLTPGQQVHLTHDGQHVSFTMPSNYQPPSYSQVTQQATNSHITLTNVPQEQVYINIPYQQQPQPQPVQQQQPQQQQQQQQQFHY